MVANRFKTCQIRRAREQLDHPVVRPGLSRLEGYVTVASPADTPAHSPPVQGFPPKFSTTVEKNVEKPGFSPWSDDECRWVAGFQGAKADLGPFLRFSTRAAA